jgi:hypothetical protein
MQDDRTLEKAWKLPARAPGPATLLVDTFLKEQGLKVGENCPDPKGLVGVEVEVENVLRVNPNVDLLLWQRKEDGSLRNRGLEFVTPPLQAPYVYPALELLLAGLNSTVQFSKRTSIHVHVNVRNLTIPQIQNMLLTYHLVEPLLFKFVGGNRYNNIFCVPWTTQDGFRLAFSQASAEAGLSTLASNGEKYSALNLNTMRNFGTLEFRHMPGTIDFKKIYQWVNLLLCLKVYGLRRSLPDLVGEITSLNTNSHYHEFLKNVFGEFTPMLDISNLQSYMETQVLDVKDALMNRQFHNSIVRLPLTAASSLYQFFNKAAAAGEEAIPAKKPSKRRPATAATF